MKNKIILSIVHAFTKSIKHAGLYTAVLVLLLSSCKKEIDMLPENSFQNAVYFFVANLELLGGYDDPRVVVAFRGTYSFYFDPTAKEDTFWLPDVRILGETAANDRDIDLIAVDSATTAVAGKHYRLITNKVLANQNIGKVGVVVMHSPDLDTGTVHLTLQLNPNSDFPGPMVGNAPAFDNSYYTGTTFSLTITATPVEPPYWRDGPYGFFYQWGRVKYDFISQTLGFYIGVTPFNSEEKKNMFTYFLRVKTALDEYNLNHPGNPLTDENGNQIFL